MAHRALRNPKAALALSAALVWSCAPGAASPSLPAAPSPAEAAAVCLFPGSIPNTGLKSEEPQVPGVGLVGWRQGLLLVSVSNHVCALDPATGLWSDAQVPSGQYATDGHALLAKADDHALVFVDADGASRTIDLAGRSWLPTWEFQGWIVPLMGGGFLLAGIPQLVTVSGAGDLTDHGALPSGTVSRTGGGAAELFAISIVPQDAPWSGPDNVTLWGAADRHAIIGRSGIGGVVVERARGGLFVWLASDERWWALLPDGSSHPASVPVPVPSESRIDSDGHLLYVDTALGMPCDSTGNPPTCRTELRDATSFDLLQAGPGPSEGPAWHGETAAYLWRRPGNVQAVVVLHSPGGVRQFSLP